MVTIELLHPGVFTTVQDGGRPGHAYFAVPRSGPADPVLARRANELVGNRPDAAVLEFGLQGARLRFETPATIALTGADLQWACDGAGLDRDQAYRLRADAVLAGGFARRGRFGYLAIAGDLVREPELGSISMHARIHGRLGKGTRLHFTPSPPRTGAAPLASVPVFVEDAPFYLEVLPGPEWSALEPSSQRDLREAPWSISPQSDRVGTRLIGPRLRLREGVVFESVPLWIGCLQVDASGTPIVVGVDGGVVGGYPRVATLKGTRI